MSVHLPAPGSVLRDPEGSLGKRVAVVLVVVPVGVLFLALILGPLWAIAVGLLVIGLLVLIGIDALSAVLGWHPPHLEVTSIPYQLGSTPTVVYHRKSKRRIDVSSCEIECRLICQERATYSNGTDTSTDTRKVFEEDCGGQGEGTAEGLVARLDLTISAHAGAPSFDLGNNEVRWFVEIRADGPRLPRDTHKFQIDVGPSLDPSYRRAQDS
jgi:hypothetical protein